MYKPWLTVLVYFHRAPVFRRTALAVVGLGLYAAAVTLLDRLLLPNVVTVGAQFHGMLGLVLGLLLVFRTNTSYDRWWEARKLWGQLVNDSRNLAIKVAACVRADAADKHRLGRCLADFAWGLKGHLQGGQPLQDLAGFRQATERPAHVPVHVATKIYEHVERWRRTGQLDGFEFWVVDQHTAALMHICGACERIQRTPIAFSHLWFVRQAIALYVVTLPWGLVEQFGAWTIPFTMLLSYLLIGVELIAEAIEDPFGHSDDDLRLDEICQGIERSVGDILPPVESASRG
ncbi:MAG: bestrophin family ion channel [Pirellulales bacterium]